MKLKKSPGKVVEVKEEGEIKTQPKLAKVYLLSFYWDNKLIGNIEMKGKKLHFEGDADKSARALFDKLKDFVEQYIEERLKN